MIAGVIRFEQEQQDWKAWEASVGKKYGSEILDSGLWKKERLAHLEGLEVRYRPDANKYERAELELLKLERRKIEKQLYPNRLSRLFYRFKQMVAKPKQRNVLKISIERNFEEVKSDLKQRGFGAAIVGFEEQAKLGKQEFTIPVSYNITETKSMSFQIQIHKDYNGNYQFKDCVASLNIEGITKGQGKLSFESIGDKNLTADKAFNLLDGRSVKVGDDWKNLDFNDRDTFGNCRVQTFPPGYGFDLDKLLNATKGTELESPLQLQEIKTALENGEQVTLSPVGRGPKILVEANPKKLYLIAPQEKKSSVELGAKDVPKMHVEELPKEVSKMKVG